MAQKTESQKVTAVKKVVKELLGHLGVETKIKVATGEDIFQVQLETDDPGILIGYHGETLMAIQKMAAMIIYRQSDEWLRITVDVGDYRQRRQEVLEKMALSVAQKARFSKESQALPPMPPSERRIIHLALAEETDVETASEGEGNNRHVVVLPKA
jgi:spoIIIJ-associated protein